MCYTNSDVCPPPIYFEIDACGVCQGNGSSCASGRLILLIINQIIIDSLTIFTILLFIDICNYCSIEASCIERGINNFSCVCTTPGFQGDGINCLGNLLINQSDRFINCEVLIIILDIDECASSPCRAGEYCTNNRGGYNCSTCGTGYYLGPNGCTGND